jgi:hypothetical protein
MIALLILHALLLAWSAAANSATFDEPAHLAAGAEYWRHGDFSIYSLSPPLLRLWAAAVPVAVGADVPDPASTHSLAVHDRHWTYADGFVYGNFSRFAFLLMIGRWGMIPLSCLAAWITYRWTRQLYGTAAGLAACALYCLCPSILAHGSLVTTDIGTAAAILLAAYLWWRFCQTPTTPRWAAALAALVAAHLCKFTAVLLWPMMLVMALPFVLQAAQANLGIVPNRRRILRGYILMIPAALLLLNAIYGFHGTGRPIGSFHFYSDSMQNLQAHLPVRTPSPLPAFLLQGLDAQKYDTQSRYSGFLFGEIYPSTKWYFYPAALLCKLPVSMLLLAACAGVSLLMRGGRKWAQPVAETSMLAAGFVFAAGVVLLSDVNIGTRYLLPAFPLCIIGVSRLWSEKRVKVSDSPVGWVYPPTDFNAGQKDGGRVHPPYKRWACNALLAMLACETLFVCPRFLSFINIAAGSPRGGWNRLTDSDFDWGQSLCDLRIWMADQKVSSISFAYFGLVDPKAYGVSCVPIDDPNLKPYVAVSSYYLNGFSNRMVTGNLKRAHLKLDYCKELQTKAPLAVVGNTIFIYNRRDVEDAMRESQAAVSAASIQP